MMEKLKTAETDGQKRTRKTGLLVEGGGMKCAYAAGILDKFLDEKLQFDYMIGVSAGSACLASYAAGQRGRNRRFFTVHLSEPGYFGPVSLLKKGELFGLHYIYATLTNSDGPDPLDYEAMIRNPAEMIFVATDAHTGRSVYFTKEQISKDDYRIIMASCAIPAISQPIEVDGTPYFDGGASDSLPLKKALEDDCTKTVVILARPRGYMKKPQAHRREYTFLLRKYPNVARDLDQRHKVYNEQMDFIRKEEKEGRVFVFAPSQPLAMSTYDMNPVENQKLYNLGKKDFAVQRSSLIRFLQQ